MNQLFEELQAELEKAVAFNMSMNLFDWDDETLAPPAASKNTSKTVGVLSECYHNILAGEKVKTLLDKLKEDDSLNEMEKAVVRNAAWNWDWMNAVPASEYRELSELTAESTAVWVKAKNNKNFDEFAPTLEKIVDFQKKFASYRAEPGESLYNVMLKDFEKDFNTELLDEFFGQLRAEIVPLLKRVEESGKKIKDGFLVGDYSDEGQRELGIWAATSVGFDFEKGVLAVSAHPFTTALHNHDVRITTHYTENLSHSLYSIIHEAGHGIYELGISDEITQTIIGEGASMAMHESQSRFFENMIGKHPAFIARIFAKAKEIFPEQLGEVTPEQFMEAVNKVTPGPVRIEADELTYCLHIMIRYEIEKQLIDGSVKVSDLPKLWNQKYEEYLGVTPEDVSVGVLQDIHWSQGSFGYFPSYALGSAFGAQLYYHMEKELGFEQLMEQGDIGRIREYLREHIHQFGMMKTARELLSQTTGEDFNPSYYVRYLKEKYEALYGLK